MSYRGNAEYVDTRGAAELCGLRPMTLHNYRHYGRGPKAVTEGRHVFYKATDVADWNAARPRRQRKH